MSSRVENVSLNGVPHFRQEVLIVNESGLHMRPASMVAALSQRFQCDVVIWKNNVPPVDGKSILQLMTLSADAGTVLTLETRGPDAEEAIIALRDLVSSGFHDGE